MQADENRGRELERQIGLDCENVVLRFMAHFDAGEYEQMTSLLAPDGVWHQMDGDIRGPGELVPRLSKRPAGVLVRHVITNLRTEILTTESAVVHSYVTVLRHDFPGAIQPPAPLLLPLAMGRYRDELVRSQGRWQILNKKIMLDFKRQA
jgi:hypothetical protein